MQNSIRRFLFLILLLSTNAAILEAQQTNSLGTLALQPARPLASFIWRMQDRFGVKGKNDLLDYRWDELREVYDPLYVNPKNWIIDFDGCNPSVTSGSYVWEIDGQVLAETRCRFSHPFTAQGDHSVKLTVTTPAGESASFDSVVTVKDLFIVSIGDSYASGEGNPDKPWEVVKRAKWIDSRCHRSATAGPALAALAIEKDDPHSAVTFISFACSGAGLKEGLTGEFKKGSARLPPQLDQVVDAAKGRPIDALLISIGGNDVNFGALVLKAIRLRHAETDAGTAKLVREGLNVLQQRYADVGQRLRTMNVTKVFITEYPVIVRNQKKNPCDHSPKFPDLLNGISKAEAEWAERSVIRPLNDKVREAAALWGWVYVTGIADKFSGEDPETIAHGYCAEDERWVRTFNDSWKIQGNQNGTAHPNQLGHSWYAKRLVLALQENGVIAALAP